MGRNKSMLKIGKLPIIQHIANILDEIFSEVFVIANEKEKYQRMGFSVVGDIYPGYDSLGGLHSAVAIAKGSHVFVVGCDMPLLKPNLISGIASMVNDWDVVIPIKNNHPEPLCAFYGKKCKTYIEKSISTGDLKMVGFHTEARVRKVDEATWRVWDPNAASFLNANTKEEFEKIQAMWATGKTK